MTPDTDKLATDQRRGERAQAILEDALFVEAHAAIRDRLIAEWEAAPARDAEGRERLWMMVKLLERVRGHMQEVMTTGKLAAKSLADLEKRGLRERIGI